jgi:uncharacterized protein
MVKASREFQVFVKPIGSICNLGCHYCYYLEKKQLYENNTSFRMSEKLLEAYIVQHIECFPGPTINFSWHGGEPTLLGVDFFRKIVELQRRHQPLGRHITNGIQTNGTLLNENWCQFLADEGFGVGLSMDGPQDLHDRYRLTRHQEPTHEMALRGYHLLKNYAIPIDILCVVHSHNVRSPKKVYTFFKQLGVQYLTFLPLVQRHSAADKLVRRHSVKPDDWGTFLCNIFDAWIAQDIGKIKIQIFEEAAGIAFDQEHALCVFRKTCGDIPVLEHNGDVYSCDHFVTPEHRLGNIQETRLVELMESPAQKTFGQDKWDTLPRYCLTCEVLEMCNGGCPKDRILYTPDNQAGLNYLCAGYKRFFVHCRPFIEELSALARTRNLRPQSTPSPSMATRETPKTGRNAPCPCGSGRKYKKCCLGK